MISYAAVEALIYTRISALESVITTLKMYPTNFVLKETVGNFARISIILGNSSNVQRDISGLLVFQLFTTVGNGTNTVYAYADQLNTGFVGKTLTSGSMSIQFNSSELVLEGVDSDNFSYHRSTYSLKFNLRETQ